MRRVGGVRAGRRGSVEEGKRCVRVVEGVDHSNNQAAKLHAPACLHPAQRKIARTKKAKVWYNKVRWWTESFSDSWASHVQLSNAWW